jgi:secretion/DNA translocation related TadE-like protein
MNYKNDDGGITLLVIVAMLVLLTLVSFGGFVVNGFMLASKLNNSADRVALAAARHLIDDPDISCQIAAQLAEANEVNLITCEVLDDEVTVKVNSQSAMQNWLDNWENIGLARAGIDYLYE